MTDLGTLLRAAAGPRRDLDIDEGALATAEARGKRRRRRKLLAVATAAVAASVSCVAVVSVTVRDQTAETLQPAVPAYDTPAPSPGRTMRVEPLSPRGTPPGGAVLGDVVAEDSDAGHAVVLYTAGDGSVCSHFASEGSGGGSCAPALDTDSVIVQGAFGPSRDINGRATSLPALWGTVPEAATTVIVTGEGGSSDRVRAVDGGAYAVNFYLSRFNMEQGLVRVTAYNAAGAELAEWTQPRRTGETETAPDVLIVECRRSGPFLANRRVSAQEDGVHYRFQEAAGSDMHITYHLGGDRLQAGTVKDVVRPAIPGTPTHVSCAADSERAREKQVLITVEDPARLYEPIPAACEGGRTAIRAFAESATQEGDPLELTRRDHPAARPVGYPKGIPRQVFTGTELIGWEPSGRGWLPSRVTTCD